MRNIAAEKQAVKAAEARRQDAEQRAAAAAEAEQKVMLVAAVILCDDDVHRSYHALPCHGSLAQGTGAWPGGVGVGQPLFLFGESHRSTVRWHIGGPLGAAADVDTRIVDHGRD